MSDRDRIARVIYETRYGEPWYEAYDGAGRAGALREADAIMPILDVAIAAERERIATALDRVPDEVYPADVFGGPWSDEEALRGTQLLDDNDLPSYDRVAAHTMRLAYRQAARIARQGGTP